MNINRKSGKVLMAGGFQTNTENGLLPLYAVKNALKNTGNTYLSPYAKHIRLRPRSIKLKT
jgi:hypothetical protein